MQEIENIENMPLIGQNKAIMPIAGPFWSNFNVETCIPKSIFLGMLGKFLIFGPKKAAEEVLQNLLESWSVLEKP